MTIEHLGCSEWVDNAERGFHPTGEHETFGVWVSQGKLFEATRDALVATGGAMARTALLRPPVQFGVGGAFQTAGVPQIGAIAGPEYLLTIKRNGDMEKLDERLAAAQTAWLADILRRIDPISAEQLRAGDPTLGSFRPGENESTRSSCGPAGAAGSGKCLSRRSPIGPRNVGRVRLGYTRKRLLRLPVKPRSRTRRAYRYCVKRSRGRVTAVFSSRSKRGKVRLVTTTARRHGNRRIGVGTRAARFLRRYPNRRPVTKGIYRARRGSRRLFGVRRGRVRFIAVADKGLARNARSLKRYLRLAGLGGR
jgi:hypothetical protein